MKDAIKRMEYQTCLGIPECEHSRHVVPKTVSFLFRHLTPLVCEMEHEVARQGLADGFGVALSVDKDAGRGELTKDIEAFQTGYKGATGFLSEGVGERTGNGGIPHKVVAIQRLVAIATS